MNVTDQLCAEINEKCKRLYGLYELEKELGLTWQAYCKMNEQDDEARLRAGVTSPSLRENSPYQ